MKIFCPKKYVRSVQDIDLKSLKDRGITNLIVDLDETLRKRNASDIPDSSIQWIDRVKKMGFKICISSNNFMPWKREEVESQLHIPVVMFQLKPFSNAFRTALKMLGSNPQNTAMIGDQLFTDIYGANIMGIYSILVDPITGAEKGFFRRIMRRIERLVLRIHLR